MKNFYPVLLITLILLSIISCKKEEVTEITITQIEVIEPTLESERRGPSCYCPACHKWMSCVAAGVHYQVIDLYGKDKNRREIYVTTTTELDMNLYINDTLSQVVNSTGGVLDISSYIYSYIDHNDSINHPTVKFFRNGVYVGDESSIFIDDNKVELNL